MDFKGLFEKAKTFIISFFDSVKANFKLYTKKALNVLYRSRVALFAVSLAIGIILTIVFSGITIAYNVEYNGAIVAQIKTKAQYSQAITAAKSMIYGDDFSDFESSPKFHVTFTTKKNLDSSNEVAASIIEQTDSFSKGTAVKVDGEVVACVSTDLHIEKYIANYLDTYIDSDDDTTEFVKDVRCEIGYYANDLFINDDEAYEVIKSLDVKTVQVKRMQRSIPFTSVTRKSSSRVLGDIETVVKGVNGVKETVETLEMINGEVVNSTVESEVIISEPVQEVIVIGTKKDTSNSTYASQLGCIWPLKRVANQAVSAYYGDGRNHKGVDICCATGTPIYAAQSGTVVTSKYSSSYGYYVIIDHGNGYKTLYAHCSKLLVNVGEVVYQGEVIALVGSTGISTGSHLHFEVIRNGVNLNPASFIGL